MEKLIWKYERYKNKNFIKKSKKDYIEKIVLNLGNKALEEEEIRNLLNKLHCSDLIIISLPEELQERWENMSPENYKGICEKINAEMKSEDITHIILDCCFPLALTYMFDMVVENYDLLYLHEDDKRFYKFYY